MSVLESSTQGGVATLRLNRPEALNAISAELAGALLAELDRLAADAAVRAVLLTGNGRGFCAGADLGDVGAELLDGDASALRGPAGVSAGAVRDFIVADSAPLAEAMLAFPKPLVAAVNGPCAGAGLGLALAADILVASEEASFSVVFIRRGLVPDYGVTHLLPRLVGLRRARELCLLGDKLSAAQADQLGLVTAVVPAERLLDEAHGYAERLAAGPGVAQRLTKGLLADSFALDARAAIEREFTAQALCFTTHDAVEGVSAFLEKRAPRFRGA